MRLIYLFSAILCFVSCSSNEEHTSEGENQSVELLQHQKTYVAGGKIDLSFETESTSEIYLLISNAFGNSVLTPIKDKNKLHFTIPKNFSRKTGPCHWILVANGEQLLKDSFRIEPKTSAQATLETYFGPRSITAGIQDYSMLVNVTTDPFDNVYPEGTEVIFKSQFLNSISEYTVPSKDLISWKNIYSTTKSGRILVNTSFKNITSKELTTIVFPTLGEAFEIETDRNHAFADGNQIMVLRSGIIQDKYNNIVGDGTMVNFIIKNSKGAILKSMAPTINGIAKASILHPSEKEEWQIDAYITGAAKSNSVSIDFDAAITDYSYEFSENNRLITVGPLVSFMDQLVPDGILIQLEIFSETGQYLETKKVSSIKGLGKIEVPKEFYPDGSYRFICKTAGIIKEFEVTFNEE